MTSDAYETLFKTAARRIEQEWTCNDSESAILTLIAALSYGMGQSWACIPCLGDMAAATGFHKATISRSVRSAVKKRYLITAKFGEEMLYKVCTGTKGEGAPPDAQARALARAKLEEIQRTRLRGQADADGQMRMPGMFASEELDAPAAAFEAMMEDVHETRAGVNEMRGAVHETAADETPADRGGASVELVPHGTENVVRPGAGKDPDAMTPQEFSAHLEAIAKEYDRKAVAGSRPQLVPKAGVRSDSASLDLAFSKMTRGLPEGAVYALQLVRTEVAAAGKVQEAQFLKSAPYWRDMATKHPRHLAEVAADHKSRRKETGWCAGAPAGWISSVLREMLGNLAATD